MSVLRYVIASAVMGILGCNVGESTKVVVDIYTADGDQHADLLAGAGAQGGASEMELVLLGGARPYVKTFQIGSRTGSLTGLPVGGGYRLVVRGFEGTSSDALFYGASAEFEVVDGKDRIVSVQAGRSSCVGLNKPSRYRTGGTADMAFTRVGMTSTVLPDGRVLVIGGAAVDTSGRPAIIHDSIEIYDPQQAGFVTATFALDQPRAFHSATLLETGQVMLVGGITGVPDGNPAVTATATLIDVDAAQPVRAFATPIPSDARSHHQAVALSDGKGSVLIVGGQDQAERPLASVVRFFPPEGGDPINGTFEPQGNLHLARTLHTVTAIDRNTEKVIVAGGLGADGPLDSVEIFSITDNPEQMGCADESDQPSFREGCFIQPRDTNLPSGRFGHVAVPVNDGKEVLFVGGFSTANREEHATDLALFVSADLGLIPVGSLDFGRGDLAAIELSDGDTPFVLAVGGRTGGGIDGSIGIPQIHTTRLRRVSNADGTLAYQAEPIAAGCMLPEARYGLGAVALRNGTGLLFGGVTGAVGMLVASRRVEVFFPRVIAVSDD